MLEHGNDDAVTGPDVVKEEVAEGMKSLVAQRRRHDEGAAMEGRPRRCRDQRADMAGRASDGVEERRPLLGIRRRREPLVPGRSLRGPDKPRKAIDVRETVGAGLVLGILYGIANRRYLRWEQAICDSHLVQVGVGREREQARLLILPTEATDPIVARSLQHRHRDGLPADAALRLPALPGGNAEQRLIGHGFDEAIAEETERHAQGTNGLARGNALLDLLVGKGTARANGPVVDERPAGDDHGAAGDRNARVDEASLLIPMAGAQLGHLTDAAGCGVLMAFPAGLRVVERPKAVADLLDGVEGR